MTTAERYQQLRRLARTARQGYLTAQRIAMMRPSAVSWEETMREAGWVRGLRRREERWDRLAVKVWNDEVRRRAVAS